MSDELNYVLHARREKLEALAKLHVAPFGYGFERKHRAAQCTTLLGDAAEGPQVQLAGRIVAWRAHGKSSFAHLGDPSGRVQLYFKKDVVGESVWAVCDLLDLGDVVGATGPLFRTRTGEVTVHVEHVELLAKSLRPLPFGKEEVVDGKVVRHSAFSDGEMRSRQRYADLAVHPEVRALFRKQMDRRLPVEAQDLRSPPLARSSKAEHSPDKRVTTERYRPGQPFGGLIPRVGSRGANACGDSVAEGRDLNPPPLPGRLKVGRRTLNPRMHVRVMPRQPFFFSASIGSDAAVS